jgi:type II secretory pathway pseudopilin PulG
MTRAKTTRVGKQSEEGYVLLTAIFLMALVVIALALAAPKIARSIQRDRDLETYHRGLQYRRAVQLYYRKFHAYPPNADALVQTNNIRFLRRKYIDPSTGKNDWKPIQFGQNKTPTAMGFFGQPLSGGGSTIAGIGPTGGNGVSGTGGSLPGGIAGLFGGGSSSGAPTGTSNSGFLNSPTTGTTDTSGGAGTTGGTGTTDTSGNSGATGGTGTSATSTSGGSSGTSGSSGSSSSTGLSGQTFGGAGIIGFSPASPNQSILVYKKKQHYNEWEFTYDPISELKGISGGNTGAIGQPASSTTTPIGASSPFGTSPGSSPGASPPQGPGPGLPMNPAPMPPDLSAPPQQ